MTADFPPIPAERALKSHGPRFALFSAVGAFNTLTDFAVFCALAAAGADPVAANTLGFLAANAQSYAINSRVTFRKGGRPAETSVAGFLKFAGAHAFSLVLSSAAILFLADVTSAVAAKVAAALVSALWNYATSALFAFAPRPRNEGRAL